ncbi:15184_t:CDS:2 [Entrophospora sp. SA101]|nr:15184_t:CDS:2 [Entrophospora sp. SA101]
MDTSEWTLDYPPFFAWFEWVLSKFATFYDDEMVKVENSNYSSQETIYFQRTTGNDLLCGITFAILLNFKHIFLYLSPAYFIYLLRNYCFKNTTDIKVLGRLFPFKRGLCHAYWAPNFWALYSALDRVLIVAGKQLGLELNEAAVDSVTRGLVGDVDFAILPTIKPIYTFIITLMFQLFPTYMNFLKSLISCGYSSFLFGWHVHEKAVLLVLIPFSLIVSENYHLLRTFMILSTSGLISLLPLLFKATGKCDI